MVVLTNPENYKLLGFEISQTKNKKYDAILENKFTKDIKRIPFGDVRYYHYFDKIGHYSHLNHNDKERRKLYKIRHKNEDKNKFSSGYFSLKYLW